MNAVYMFSVKIYVRWDIEHQMTITKLNSKRKTQIHPLPCTKDQDLSLMSSDRVS